MGDLSTLKTAAKTVARMSRGRMPGQLVIQMTDRCNATCPQCGMRKSNAFPRTRLSTDRIKSLIDAAAEKGVQAVSFTGGEPMLLRKDLAALICHAGKAGIPYIRTGTNGYFFAGHDRSGFTDRIQRIADELAATPLRNFWISLDSAATDLHESMRGFDGVVRGMEKALPLFHGAGLFPSVNLGLNRNVTAEAAALAQPGETDLENPEASAFYQTFKQGFSAFYRKVIDMGFTIANACYPMSMDDAGDKSQLDAVYAAASPDRVVCFTRTEKALLFKALLDTIPRFRSRIRIFSPLTSLYVLYREYAGVTSSRAYPCPGGIDFFFVNCRDGNTYPCGYRGSENLGPFEDLAPTGQNPFCLACDWECFRDPAELGGPVAEALTRPARLAGKIIQDPARFRTWLKDVSYYRACDYFNGRIPPAPNALERFS
jgi:uncharacterized Fe-S cluster-containing radical SAM superfamily protein